MNVEIIIKTIYDLIKSYEIFYSKIELDKKIKYTNLIESNLDIYNSKKWNIDLEDFIKLYIEISKSVKYLLNFSRKIYLELSLSEEDLYVLINRSQSYIFEQLSEIKKIQNETKNIKSSLKTQYKILNNYLDSFLTKLTYDKIYTEKYISNILDSLISSNDIKVLYNILNYLIEKNIISKDNKLLNEFIDIYITKLFNIDNKKITYENKDIKNYLQRFNIVPDDIPVNNLQYFVKLLFNTDINLTDNIFKILDKLLKSLSNDSNNKSIVIKYNTGSLSYIDISKLLSNINSHDSENLKQIKKETGVTPVYINLYNNLHSIQNNDNKIENRFICINTENIDNESDIYVLFTNDFNNFRIKTDPIKKELLDKLMINEPSQLISKYNLSMEKAILDKRIESIDFEFKKIYYYNFTDIPSEDITLKNMEKALISFINSEIDISYKNKKGIYGLAEIINKNTFNDKISEILYKFIPIKSDNQLLDAIFMNDTALIVKKLKKEIIDISNKYSDLTNEDIKKYIPDILNYVLMPNSNIYNKYMNAYYLSMLHL